MTIRRSHLVVGEQLLDRLGNTPDQYLNDVERNIKSEYPRATGVVVSIEKHRPDDHMNVVHAFLTATVEVP